MASKIDARPPSEADKFRAKTDFLLANADRNVADTIRNIRNTPGLEPAIDQACALTGASKASLYTLTHFESSGGVLDGSDLSHASGPFQFTKNAFDDAARRLMTPENIEKIRTIDPQMADDFAGIAGMIHLVEDPPSKKGEKPKTHLQVDDAAKPILEKYRDNNLAQAFFAAENQRIHEGRKNGSFIYERLRHNWGPTDANRILSVDPKTKMSKWFGQEKLAANLVPGDVTVGDFLKQEVDVYSLYVQHMDTKLAAAASQTAVAVPPSPAASTNQPSWMKLASSAAQMRPSLLRLFLAPDPPGRRL